MATQAPSNATPAQQLRAVLLEVAEVFNATPALRDQLRGTQGWIDALVGFRTDDGATGYAVEIQGGEVRIHDAIPEHAEACVVFASSEALARYMSADADEVCRMILAGQVRVEGNLAVYGYLNYLGTLVGAEDEIEAGRAQAAEHRREARALAQGAKTAGRALRAERAAARLEGERVDPGVRWLEEPYLARYGLDDFPRLARFKAEHLETLPEVTAEQGRLLTDFHLEHGFETRRDGTPWDPSLRAAAGFHHVMSHRQPVLRPDDLLAGTFTPNPICGAITQPYAIGWTIWGELRTIHARELDPYTISDETIETLHRHVFPFWRDRNIHQRWLDEFDTPLAARIADRNFCLNLWSLVSLNPGAPGFERILKLGLRGLREEIERALDAEDAGRDAEQRNTLEAMRLSLDAVAVYTGRLAQHVADEAAREADPTRRAELEHIHATLCRVPEHPAETLDQAVQAIWIALIALGIEGMDDDIALGRLDQLLQPYLDAEMERTTTEAEREALIRHAIELVGCLFLRVTSHRVGAPTIASWQNSGAPAVSTVVVGGVKPDGSDAVNDMSYVVLKVAEMLCLDDPNMHARFMPGINSRAFLERVCEVNYLTAGTPALHNDAAVIGAWTHNTDWAVEDLRDWTPAGCVEPVIAGKHVAATGDIDSNLMAPLTMALNDGYHPVARWQLGPRTGKLADFETFEAFFSAFRRQFEFVYERALEGSHQLLRVHQELMPCPFQSTLLEGCIAAGHGLTRGGAKYNSSGASLIGLADVVDSLLVIQKLVFEQRRFPFEQLRQALEDDFHGHPRIHAWVQNAVPRFGSGDAEALAMAQRVTRMVADFLHPKRDGRGGHYTTGYRTNNNHTVYGRVSGASPSGRLAGQPFTPGLTPAPGASKNLLDNVTDVARLDPETLDNNISFNVRLSFSSTAGYRERIAHVADIAETYFRLGGMQMQFNMVDSDTLRDAMANPEYYADLLVRVSGYTGYYTRMQRDLQLEILGRSEYDV